MTTSPPTAPRERRTPLNLERLSDELARFGPGLVLAVTIALAATFVADRAGGPAMLYALCAGAALNRLLRDAQIAAGIDFAASSILKFGVILLGAQITLSEIQALGLPIVVLVISGVMVSLFGGCLIGRALGLSREQSALTAGAVSICGASAALAISSVLPRHADREQQTLLTVIGVTTLSTFAMVGYPLIAQALDFSAKEASIFLGASIHDVAQVAGAGHMLSDEVGEMAIFVKLLRVACLAPAVMMIALWFRHNAAAQGQQSQGAVRQPPLPLFLVCFIALIGINSTGVLSLTVSETLSAAGRWCLLVAVAALGVKTSFGALAALGLRPLIVLVLQTALIATYAIMLIFVLTLLAGN